MKIIFDRSAVTYEPGLIVEFHRMARGAVRRGVKEKRFKSGEQWEVLRREIAYPVRSTRQSMC